MERVIKLKVTLSLEKRSDVMFIITALLFLFFMNTLRIKLMV